MHRQGQRLVHLRLRLHLHLHCGFPLAVGCPKPKTQKKGNCKKTGVQTFIRQYFVYNKRQAKCEKKFRLTEHPCEKKGSTCTLDLPLSTHPLGAFQATRAARCQG